MTDQELQKIAENTSTTIDLMVSKYCGIGYSNDNYDRHEVKAEILKSLTQVRDAQENQIGMLEANEAVQNVLITVLKNKVDIAIEALSGCVNVLEKFEYQLGVDYGESETEFKGQLSTDLFYSVKNRAKQALERMGDV